MYDANKVPRFMQAGLYKVHIVFFKDNTLTSGVEVIVTLT